jgi:prepilin-type N-terminal cleavage/methylation domain-containing protein
LKSLRARIHRSLESDSGFTLIEVIVAMFIFTLLSTGILYGMLAVLQLTRDARSTQVATNLASQEIDLARTFANDLFALVDYDTPLVVTQPDGSKFYVKRTTNWVSDPGVDLKCGASAGGGALRYKRVNIEVSWDNMASAASAVKTYTVINPAQRINDPSKGTILVSVTGETGIGKAGVTVTAVPASPANGATAITVTPTPTDAQGCTYILKVVPGNYTVKVSKSNFIDSSQKAVGEKFTGVTAGASTQVGFTFDEAATFATLYNTGNLANAMIPRNLQTSYVSTYPTFTSVATSNSKSKSVKLFPFSGGYAPIAGALVDPVDLSKTCPAVDPDEWAPVTVAGIEYKSVRSPSLGATPGGGENLVVSMGTVVVNMSGTNRSVKAVSQNRTPTCANTQTYVFDGLGPDSKLALPYGSWLLYYGSSSSQTTVVSAPMMSQPTGGSSGTGLSGVGLPGFGANELVLDPRSAP